MSSALDAPPALLGSTLPRLMTPPLIAGPPGPCECRTCALTELTSYGFDVIWFAENVVGVPLDPWECLAAVHLGELLADGRPRFRTVLILVARQNGKTLLAKILILYWMFIDQLPLTMITSTDRSYAKRTWTQVIAMAQESEHLTAELDPNPVRKTIGEESFGTLAEAELIFAANNARAGRSTTLFRWLCDELREHKNRDAWDSATNAQNAVREAQTVAITNQGDEGSVVLDALRGPAVEYIETGQGDERLGLLEWSSPDGAEPDDVDALLQANPNAGRPGHGPDIDALLAAAGRAKRAGGLELSGFRTEVMCQRVHLLDPAIEPGLWAAAKTAKPLDLAQHRNAVALALDVSLAGDHAALIAAALIDGVVHLDVVAAWSGYGCTKALRAELPGIVAKVRPRVLGWLPSGPAAVVAADLMERRSANWPPRRVKLEQVTTDAAAAAMSFAELVLTGEISHPDDPMLNAHIANAQRLRLGDRWTFGRRGSGPVNGAYAAAVATWLARTLSPPPAPLSVA